MKFALLVYENSAAFAERDDPKKRTAYWSDWAIYTSAIRDAGIMLDGAGFQPPDNGVVVQIVRGKLKVEEGPYAGTNEQLGGYYVIDVPDLDTALDWAARLPCATTGKVEVRPLLQRGPR